jgi:hypothetical protein
MPIDRSARSAVIALALATALAVPLAIGPASAAPTAPAPSTPATSADPAASALPGGPRPTSIRLSEDDASTTVLVHGLGSAATEQARENRSYRHSDLQPTARFARGGDELTITVPGGAPRLSVGIGLTGVYAAHNDGAEKGLWRANLSTGTNTVTAPLDGMVHLISTDLGGSAEVTVEGGEPVPAFVRGQTSNEAFRAEMTRLDSAPFVQVIGDRFFGDFQKPRTGQHIMAADVTLRVSELDDFIRITNDTYGLRDDGTGVARKAPHRIYIASADSSGGYANASHDRIMFQVDTGAAADLFRAPRWDQWGFWHEVGHTYQTPTFNWSGLGEVLVNLSPLHVQSAYGWTSRLDGQVAHYDSIFAKPVETRSFQAEGNVWGRLFFFDHLRRGFGDGFYPQVNQELRVLKARGENIPATDEQKRQLLAVTAARVADRDLREFFRQWGIPLSADTAAIMAELPALEQPIWENRSSTTMIREYDTAPFSVPLGEIDDVSEQVTLGQRNLSSPPSLSDLRDSDGEGTVTVSDTVLIADAVGTGTATVTVTNDIGVREVFSTPVTVTPGTSFQFRGLSDRIVASLALQPAAGELRLFAGTSYDSHPNFGASEYIGATVHDARGRETAAFSVAGNDTAHAAARMFDGTAIRDGMYLTVRHREANSRSTRWDGGTQVARNPATTQHYRVDGGRLVGVPSIPTAPDGPLVGLPVTEPVALSRSAPTEVPVTVEATDAIDSVTGELVLTAPEGTRFADPQEALVTQVRQPGGDWVALDTLVADGAVRSDDGGTLTLAIRSTGDLGLTDGTQLRWAPEITVPASAAGGDSELRWTLTGTADRNEVAATS